MSFLNIPNGRSLPEEMDVNQFDQICLILKAKFGNNSLRNVANFKVRLFEPV